MQKPLKHQRRLVLGSILFLKNDVILKKNKCKFFFKANAVIGLVATLESVCHLIIPILLVAGMNIDVLDLLPSITLTQTIINRGSYMSAHVLLNLLNELRKRDKMRGLLNSIIQENEC